jgi:hypothetical protein
MAQGSRPDFGRPSGTRTVYWNKPAMELPAYYRKSLRDKDGIEVCIANKSLGFF